MDIVGCNIDKGSDSSMVNEMGMGYVLIHVVVVLDTSEVDFWLLIGSIGCSSICASMRSWAVQILEWCRYG